MPTEQIGKYEMEYEAAALPDSAEWAAFVTVYGPSDNPLHRKTIVPRQRVALETRFPRPEEAETAARDMGLKMVG